MTISPKGFKTYVTNLGIKDGTKDFLCVHSSVPCQAAGVFTQSRFAGPSIIVSKKNIRNAQAQTIVAISKNANVATGAGGLSDAQEIVASVAKELSMVSDDVLIASTGVIGRRYPMEKIRNGIMSLQQKLGPANFADAAEAIMTTDLVPKILSARIGDAVLVGIAKGVGMMEPNMATLLTFFFTDAAIENAVLDGIFRRVMDKTFNCLSIDTDTSTSDTAIILANGLSGDVDLKQFETALEEMAVGLVKKIAKDGEGATKMLEVTVRLARDDAQAKRVAKSIVNSPLVKTAIHGADPNWGRVAMAIGKCSDDTDIMPENTVIKFGDMEVYPRLPDESALAKLEQMLKRDEVNIHVELNIGQGQATVWGCDLSKDYIKINGEYTT